MPKEDVIVAEGRQAFAEGKTTRDLPEFKDGAKEDAWLHGWWGAFYSRQGRDERAIATWLDNEITEMYSSAHCKAIAEILIHRADYDRTQPIEVRLGGLAFTIPAPVTLGKPTA
jgi:hypothetical protein